LIISRTPYRISFFGGGSDYPSWYNEYGGEVLSTAIDKYVYLSMRELPLFFKHKYRIVYSKIEIANNLDEIRFNVIKQMIKYYKVKNNLEIHYDGDLPARSGMGSSSSFVVGLIKTFSCFLNNKITKKKLAHASILFEQKILKELVGSQDQVAASYGGFNSIKFNKKDNFSINKYDIDNNFFKELNENLVLVFSGINRTANIIASSYVKKLNSTKKKDMLELIKLVPEAKKIIKNESFDQFGSLLHESWMLKKSISKKISTDKIDLIYDEAIKQGAIGGKLLGAGGGGFLLFYVPKEKQKNFLKKFKKIISIKFNFTNQASSIIYNSNNAQGN
jgi:D-glycero-alpha-D-manno-heptose-7-phosphate kinase